MEMEMDDAASRSRPGTPSGRSDVSESDHPSDSDENLWDDTVGRCRLNL